MRWKELCFSVQDVDRDDIEAELEAIGALSITLEDAADEQLLEPAPDAHPLWKASRVRALFDFEADVGAISSTLWQQLKFTSAPPFEINTIEDRQWQAEWRQDLRPLRFGRRLWVCPSDYEPPEPGAVNLVLDPGLAFGTGTHPSTALCLKWLEQADVEGKSVVDYGCGSGILAIAAAHLGARHVWAVDHDAQALTATQTNALCNGVAGCIETVAPDAFTANGVTLVLANILARPLIELAARFAALIVPHGQIVLSGVLESQQDALVATYARWFALQPWAVQDGWLCLHGQRLGSAR